MHDEIRREEGARVKEPRGWRRRLQGTRAQSFITVCAASALGAAGAGNIDIFIFPLNLICVMDELPWL